MITRNSAAARIAVVGAGLAGLAAARRLVEAGAEATLFEKSRGVGGRLATRRDGAGAGFDHGAQFATARGPGFARYLDAAIASGDAARWTPARAEPAEEAAKERVVGAPRMRALVAPLVRGLEAAGARFRFGAEVAAIRKAADGWRLDLASAPADEERYDAVVLSAPAPQAARLAAAFPDVVEALGKVEIAPCWALMLALDGPWRRQADVFVDAAPEIAWLARDGSKPGRAEDGVERWVAHASADWSCAHLELSKEAAAEAMLALLSARFGAPACVVHAVAHRWRYARVETPLGRPCLEAAEPGLVLCGDWLLGARVEAAFDSGDAAAAAIIDRFSPEA